MRVISCILVLALVCLFAPDVEARNWRRRRLQSKPKAAVPKVTATFSKVYDPVKARQEKMQNLMAKRANREKAMASRRVLLAKFERKRLMEKLHNERAKKAGQYQKKAETTKKAARKLQEKPNMLSLREQQRALSKELARRKLLAKKRLEDKAREAKRAAVTAQYVPQHQMQKAQKRRLLEKAKQLKNAANPNSPAEVEVKADKKPITQGKKKKKAVRQQVQVPQTKKRVLLEKEKAAEAKPAPKRRKKKVARQQQQAPAQKPQPHKQL